MRETQITPVKRLTIVVCLLLALAAGLAILVWHLWQSRQPGPVKAMPASSSTVVEQSQFVKYTGKYCYAGEPVSTEPLLVLTNAGYVVGYSERRKDPAWVGYRLFKVDSLQAPPRPQKFDVDRRTTSKVAASAYTGSGYDRGHCAPNFAIAVCYGARAQLETFLMSNIMPQRPKLNRQVWEQLESKEIRVYAQKFNSIWVIDGPVSGREAGRLPSGVEIPKACYKIIAREDEGGVLKVMAFIMPQEVAGSEAPGQFLTSVDEVERETGLDFFSELPAAVQERVESEKMLMVW